MRKTLLSLCLMLLLSSSVFAGTTGNLIGKVTDAETGEPLQGANVFLQDTNYGAPTNEDGSYEIYNIPAGTYNLSASFIGYKMTVVEKVVIATDYTKDVSIALVPSALEMEEIVVRGERSMLQKDETSTVRVTSGEEVQYMPVRSYADVVGLQAGVVRDRTKSIGAARQSSAEADQSSGLYIRGGRSNEVDFLVDGFSQKNPISGGVTASVNNNAIEQVVVTTGGYNAEYGRVMSGVVNVTTKGGGKKWSGSLESVTDEIAGDWANTTSFGNNIYSASLGGPLFSDKYRIYMSGEMQDLEDREPHYSPMTPFTGTRVWNDSQDSLIINEVNETDGILPHNDLEGWTLQSKLNLDFTNEIKLEFGGLASQSDYNSYSGIYRYNMEHAPSTETENLNVYGKMTHILDTKTFYSVAGNYFYTEYFRGDGKHQRELRDYGRTSNPGYGDNYNLFFNSDDPTTPIDRDSLGNYINDEGHVRNDYLYNESSYIGFDFDMTTQRFDNHEMKLGMDYQYHTLRRYHHLWPTQIYATDMVLNEETGQYEYEWNSVAFQDVDAYGFTVDEDALKQGKVKLIDQDDGLNAVKNPIVWSAYLQDKFTYHSMIINFGLRYDYLDPKTKRLKDENSPLGADGSTLDDEDLTESEPYHKLSPRLGLSFPVSDKMFFHASYGKFFQQPNLQDLYVDYDYLEYKVRTGGYFFPFGNPNLNPEETTAYEIGIARQIGDDFRFDVKAYYKDVTGLVQVVNQPTDVQAFSTYKNQDFATIKGFDFTLKLRRINHLAGEIAYTLAYANGTGSMSAGNRNIAWQSSESVLPPKQTVPLDFDQRHKFSVTMDYRYDNNEGPEFGSIQPFENAGINMVLTAGSGLPYTPMNTYNEVTLTSTSAVPTGPLNSNTMPWLFSIDTKISKSVNIANSKLNFYLWIQNLLDRKNPVRVFESSGDPETTAWLYTDNGKSFLENAVIPEDARTLYEQAEKSPLYWGNPRTIRLGVVYSF